MPRDTYIRILQKYVDYLNSVCNQIITDSRLVILNQRYITCFQDGAVMPLRLKPHGFLRFHQLINIREGRVIVEDCGYCYSLSPDPDDEDQWLFRYEYLLTPPENVPHAHLHVNASKGEQQLQSIHFPTGRVSIEQVIAHLILEHHVEPKIENWFDVLFNSHQGFTQRRTDPQQSMFP